MNDFIRKTCKIGQGNDCCRYLISSSEGFECAKLNPFLNYILDDRVAKKEMNAQGDNCEGKLGKLKEKQA